LPSISTRTWGARQYERCRSGDAIHPAEVVAQFMLRHLEAVDYGLIGKGLSTPASMQDGQRLRSGYTARTPRPPPFSELHSRNRQWVLGRHERRLRRLDQIQRGTQRIVQDFDPPTSTRTTNNHLMMCGHEHESHGGEHGMAATLDLRQQSDPKMKRARRQQRPGFRANTW